MNPCIVTDSTRIDLAQVVGIFKNWGASRGLPDAHQITFMFASGIKVSETFSNVTEADEAFGRIIQQWSA